MTNKKANSKRKTHHIDEEGNEWILISELSGINHNTQAHQSFKPSTSLSTWTKKKSSVITDAEFKRIQESFERKDPPSQMIQLFALLVDLKRRKKRASRKEIKRKIKELGDLISKLDKNFGPLSKVVDFQTKLKGILSLISQGKVDEILEKRPNLTSDLLEIQKEIAKLRLQKAYWKQEIKKFYEENPQAALQLIKSIPNTFFQIGTRNATFYSSMHPFILNQSSIPILRDQYCLTDDSCLFREILAIDPQVLKIDDLYVSALVSKLWVATRDNNKKLRDEASAWLRKVFTKLQRQRRYYSAFEIFALFTAFRVYFAELTRSFKELRKQYNAPSILKEEFSKKHPELARRGMLSSIGNAETFPVVQRQRRTRKGAKSYKHKNTNSKSRRHNPEPGNLASQYTAVVLKITESQVDRAVDRK